MIRFRLARMLGDQALEPGERFFGATRFVQGTRGVQSVGPVLRAQIRGFGQQRDSGCRFASLHREATKGVVGFGIAGIPLQDFAKPCLRFFKPSRLQQAQCFHARK